MKNKKLLLLDVVTVTFLTMLVMILAIFIYCQVTADGDRTFFGDGQIIKMEDFKIKGTEEEISVPYSNMKFNEKAVTLESTLPENMTGKEYLFIYNIYQDLTVRIDGIVRKEYSTDDSMFNSSSKLYIIIPLDDVDSGKPFEITYENKIKGGISAFGEIVVTDMPNFIASLLDKAGYSMIIALSEFIFGFAMIGVAMGFTKAVPKLRLLFGIAAFSIMVSMWTISSSIVKQMYFSDFTIAIYIQAFCMAMIPVALSIFFDEIQEFRYHKGYLHISVFCIILYWATTLLNITRLVHYANTMYVLDLNMVCMIIYVMHTVTRDKIKKLNNYPATPFIIGVYSMSATAIVEIIRSIVYPVGIQGLFVCIGSLIFFLCLVYAAIVMIWNQKKESSDELIVAQEESYNLAKDYMGMSQKIIVSLAKVIEKREQLSDSDADTVGKQMRFISLKLRESGLYTEQLTDEYIDLLENASALHDIGKVKVSDTILNKINNNIELSSYEMDDYMEHAAYGEEIMNSVVGNFSSEEYLNLARQLAVYHHEQWDGKGYPKGLEKKEVPLCGRIMAIVDEVDSVCMRIKDLSKREAMISQVLKDGRETKFDPEIVDIIFKYWDEYKKVLVL